MDEARCLETGAPDACRERPLVAQTWFAGATLETDRDFDRANTLLDLRWQPDVRGQYRARESQRIARAAELGMKPEEVALPRTGYGWRSMFRSRISRVRSQRESNPWLPTTT